MSKRTGFFQKLLKKQKACMAVCLAVSLVSGSICAATAFDLPMGGNEISLPASMANVSQVQAAEPVSKGAADDGSIPDDDCMYVFYSAWEGYEFKPSEYNSEYEPGDEIKITVNYNRSVGSQIASNVGGTWTTFAGDGRTLEAQFIPDDDWLNLQITDLKEASSVGIVSIDIEITLKDAARLARMNYTSKGDHHLFSGGVEEAYETDDLWLSYCDDTDWLTLVYDCTMSGQEGWGILGWGGSRDGEWINGPGYGADKKDSTAEVSVNFSVKYLRKMMHLSKGDDLDFTSLGAWSGGRIKSLVLHRGSLMPRSDVLFENGADNEEWVCKDIEQILDEDGSRFLCLKYTCSNEENYGWSVMGFGAGVDGEWKSGRSFKVSEYQPTRAHYDFMTVDQFRASMGLSWDAKVDSISLGVYNQGRILKLWLSDTPALDPGDDVEFEDEWESPNAKIYARVAEADGTRYPQDIRLEEKWSQEHPDGEQAIIDSLGRTTFLVVSYQSAGNETPTLYIEMKDGKQSHVKAVWSDGKKAVYSYDCIAKMFPGYLIPEEMKSLAISTAEKPMTISEIKTVVDDAKLEAEPLAVLTKNWSGFETEISKYHSGYQPGDTVRVTVRFDKEAPGTVAFHLNGKWRSGELQKEKEFSVTATPDDDYMSIQIGEIPRTKEYVIIRSIKVEIVGKPNYTTAVVERGTKTALLAEGAMETAKAAGLTDEQIKKGVQLIVTTAAGSLSPEESANVQSLLETYADGADTSGYGVSDCVDISLALLDGKSETPIHRTAQEMAFKVPVPGLQKGGEHDFAIARIHDGAVTLLPDLDDEASTITFRSDRFSKFAVVYGPKDCFKALRGDTSIYTFTGAWSGWEFSLNDYIEGNAGFGAGDEVRVTVAFDKETSSELHDNADWDGSRQTFENGTTHVYTLSPLGDKLNLQITDMKGEKSVKVMSVKVEITKQAQLGSITQKGENLPISLKRYMKDFKAGDTVKITVRLKSDEPYAPSMEDGSWNWTDFAETTGEQEFSMVCTPASETIHLSIRGSGSCNVEVLSVAVTKDSGEPGPGPDPGPVEALKTFTGSWGADGNTYETTYSEHMAEGSSFVSGAETTIVLTFDQEVAVKFMGNGIPDEKQMVDPVRSGEVYTVTNTVNPTDDRLSIQIGNMPDGATSVNLLTMSVVQSDVPDEMEALHTFTKAWGGVDENNPNTFTTSFSKYVDGFMPGYEVTVALTFDQEVGVKLQSYDDGEGKIIDPGTGTKTVIGKITPTKDELSVQISSDPKEGESIRLLKVEMSQKIDSLFEFKGTWGGNNSTFEMKFSEYMKGASFQENVPTTVTLTFDQAVGVKFQSYDDKSSSAEFEPESGTNIVTGTIMPTVDKLSIQAKDLPSGGVARLLKVEVTQEAAQETIHTFEKKFEKDAEGNIQTDESGNQKQESQSYSLKLKEFYNDYTQKDEVTVTVNLSSDDNFGGCLGTNEVKSDGSEEWGQVQYDVTKSESDEKYYATAVWSVKPTGDDIAVSVWWMSGETVTIDSISVEACDAAQVTKSGKESAAIALENSNIPEDASADVGELIPGEEMREDTKTDLISSPETEEPSLENELKENDAVLPEETEEVTEAEDSKDEDENGGNSGQDASLEDASETSDPDGSEEEMPEDEVI